MAKMMKMNTDDILRDYRIRALTSPLAVYEMTNLDREMSDVLSRTDLPTERKLKLYYEALNKFQVTRKNYIVDSADGKQQQQPIKAIPPAIIENLKQDSDDDKLVDVPAYVAPFQDLLGDDDTMPEMSFRMPPPSPIISTPRHSRKTRDFEEGDGSSPKRNIDKEIISLLEDKQSLVDQICDELNISRDGNIYSPTVSGSKKRKIGNLSELSPIVSKLTHSVKIKGSKGKSNDELDAVVGKFIHDKYVSRLSSDTKSGLKTILPNLKQKYASVASSLSKRSPVVTRKKPTTKPQIGHGRILKIHFNKWNQLISKDKKKHGSPKT